VLRIKPIRRFSELQVTSKIWLAFSGPNVSIKQLEGNETDFDKKGKKPTLDIFVRIGDDIPISVKFGGGGGRNKGHFTQKPM
jgi:hypothetical protein